jgi:hypothetical protein
VASLKLSATALRYTPLDTVNGVNGYPTFPLASPHADVFMVMRAGSRSSVGLSYSTAT